MVELIFLFIVARSFTADGNLLQPTGGVNSTPHTSTFLLVFARMFNNVSPDIGSRCKCASSHPCVMRLCVSSLSSGLSSHSSLVSPVFYFIFLNLDFLLFPLPCGCPRSKIPCAFLTMRSLANNAPLTNSACARVSGSVFVGVKWWCWYGDHRARSYVRCAVTVFLHATRDLTG